MTETYKRANRFSDRLTVAQSAVEWQGLSLAQQDLVIIVDGLPFLAGVPDLTERAKAIADAADRRKITGLTHNEDGATLPVAAMILDKESVRAWTGKVQSWLPPELPATTKTDSPQKTEEQLLRLSEVLAMLGFGRSTLYRRINANQFDQAHFENPARWRKSYVLSFIQKTESTEADI